MKTEKQKKALEREVRKLDDLTQIGYELNSAIDVRDKISCISIVDTRERNNSNTFSRLDHDLQIKIVDMIIDDLESQYNKLKEIIK